MIVFEEMSVKVNQNAKEFTSLLAASREKPSLCLVRNTCFHQSLDVLIEGRAMPMQISTISLSHTHNFLSHHYSCLSELLLPAEYSEKERLN